ncbi:MAG: hypothetical protein HY343_02260 [Lentisphaerae bacterium]|nr:hypothetical protein [Lentisphaerota bacterium]
MTPVVDQREYMTATWIKPNLKGILLYLAILLIGLNFMPSPTFTASLTDGKQSVSWPWLWMGAGVIGMLLLYPFCIWLGAHMPRQGAPRLLTGPLMIIPQGLIVAIAVGMFIYEPPEIHGHLERHIFLQGNTDWGGGCLFAGTIALYVVFGFTSAWYLMLTLSASEDVHGFGRTILKAFWILKFHILAFVVGGTANIGYDSRVTPNDFRNMFLFAGTMYSLSVILICALHMTRFSLRLKLALAPFFTILWLVVGSDGNTQRAGQLVQSGQDPQAIVRGKRHAIMMAWHRLCDETLGDIKELQ